MNTVTSSTPSAAPASPLAAQGAAQKKKLTGLAQNLVEYEKFSEKDVVIPSVGTGKDRVEISQAARAKEAASARVQGALRNE